MSKLNEYDIKYLIERLQKGDPIPEDYKYKLFPTKQKEYELVYAGKMRKEDVLANEDGVFPVPLQIEKVFNGEDYPTSKNDWRNMIVFGDNLQFLKTVYENKDPLIKNKVKGKVKLIYIDPPFATVQDFKGDKGQKAYSDKAKGAEFVEFVRKRLILMREILAEDGNIFVHLDWKKAQYLKVLLDEVFGENNFVNEVIWHYADNFQGNVNGFAINHNNIFWYSKSDVYTANKVMIPLKGTVRRDKRIWSKELGKLVSARDKHGRLIYVEFTEKKADDVWEIGQSSTTKSASNEFIGYPTQKPEELLRRVILAASNPDDIIMDVFAGSGTTAAVAEKLGRRWIVCDIGKLAFYTMQKRILTIEDSKDLENPKKKYSKKARRFITVNTGLYDLKRVFELKKDDYLNFVTNLFEVEQISKKIGGIQIDGQKKDDYYVLVYPYWQFTDAAVDVEYLEDLHSHIGSKIGERLYVIAPANYVDFITDYHEIGKVRYYFLKVPYQIIKELHKVQFKKFRQPQSKRNVNDLEDAVGFHFIRQPEVESKLKIDGKNVEIQIRRFQSNYLEEETGSDLENFESLAMVLIDKDYDGKGFVMDEFHFAEDLLPKKNEEETEDEIKKELRHLENITIPLNKEECGDKVMIVYIDIYGNEFKEVLNLRKR